MFLIPRRTDSQPLVGYARINNLILLSRGTCDNYHVSLLRENCKEVSVGRGQ